MSGVSRRLFVSGLGFQYKPEEFRSYFSAFGPMSECTLEIEQNTGSSRGYGFVTYSHDSSIEKCLSKRHRLDNGRDISVSRMDDEAEPEPSTSQEDMRSKKLFVSYLGVEGVTELVVLVAFQEYGAIRMIEFGKDDDGSSLYYCIVYFEQEDSVDVCLRNRHCLLGRAVLVKRAIRKEDIKKSEQKERERVDRTEKSMHGYAGYGPPMRTAPTSTVEATFPTFASLMGPAKGQQAAAAVMSSIIQQRQPPPPPPIDSIEYARMHAEKRNVKPVDPRKRKYETALAQAGFQSAYNYDPSKLSNMAGYGEGDVNSKKPEVPVKQSGMNKYGYQ